MWSDELDNKIKEATEGYHPANDDKAWDKMRMLLDKHLPQKKKRRRFILLLLPLLLAGAGIFFISQNRSKDGIKEEKNTIVQSKSVRKQPAQEANNISPSKITASKQAPIPVEQDKIIKAREDDKLAGVELQKQPVGGDISSNNRKTIKQIIRPDRKLKQHPFFGEKEYNRKTKGQENNFTTPIQPEQNSLVISADKNSINNIITPVPVDTLALVAQIAKPADEKKQPDSSLAKDSITDSKLSKQKNSAAGKFSLIFSAGPDISGIGIDSPGKWTLQYGIGFSYALSKHLSVRTGFFAGRKIYSADSSEYQSAYYPPKLQRIDANCLVYEIPLNLIYNFPVSKKHNWFIAGGLSSYLMKNETYDYFYKNLWGQIQQYSHTYKNENAHFFSIINLSGGYQYRFTDRLSLMAEPYVRIPVSGIGAGKVKLNSGGILFSIGFKPFLKKN